MGRKSRPAPAPKAVLPAYDPYNIRKAIERGDITEKDVRKEYSRLRAILHKRVERMKRGGWADSKFVQYNDDLPTLKGMKDVEVRYNIANVWLALNRKDSSIGGQQQVYTERVTWLRKMHGIVIDSVDELRQFGELMNWIKNAYEEQLYSSSQIAKMITRYGVTKLYKQYTAEVLDANEGDTNTKRFKRRLDKIFASYIDGDT